MTSRRSRKSKRSATPRQRVPLHVAALAGGGLFALLLIILMVTRIGTSSDPFERAQQMEAEGDLGSARIEAMNAVQAQPENEAAWRLLARTQLALGDGRSAFGTIERARSAGIPESRTRHLLGEAALLIGDFDLALSETSADDVDEEFIGEAARVRARTHFAQGNTQAAAEAFDFAIQANRESDMLWVDIARFRLGTGEQAGAIDAIDEAVELNPRNLEALALKGQLTRQQYGLVASLPWFEQALDIDPGHLPAMIEYAKTLGDVGRYRDMLAMTNEILEVDAGNSQALYLQAVLAARAREYRLARRIILQIDGRLDWMPAMQLLQASVDYEEQNYEAAIRGLTALLENQPANRNVVRLLGAAQFNSGDWNDVIETLGPYAQRGNADSYMLTLIGRALERQGQFGQAALFLERAASPVRAGIAPIGGRPDDLAELEEAVRDGGGAQAEVALIRSYLALGRRGDALARADRLRRDNPDAPDAHVLHGDALGAVGRFGDAAAAYATAANIRFSEPVALRMVEALQRAGQPQEARRALALYRQQNPRNLATAMVAARLNLGAGRWQQAIGLLEIIRSRVGDRDAAVLANLAWAYHEAGDADRARALSRRAYLLMPMNPATAEIYGWVLFDSGEHRERGLAMMEKARSLAPGNSGIQWHLAQAYAVLDRVSEARLAARAALAEPRFSERDEAEALLARL